MRAEQIIACVMVEMAEEGSEMFIKNISKRLFDHKKQGGDVFGVTLQKTPLGFHSREVAEFAGRLVVTRLATQGNPLILTQEGIEWLKTCCN